MSVTFASHEIRSAKAGVLHSLCCLCLISVFCQDHNDLKFLSLRFGFVIEFRFGSDSWLDSTFYRFVWIVLALILWRAYVSSMYNAFIFYSFSTFICCFFFSYYRGHSSIEMFKGFFYTNRLGGWRGIMGCSLFRYSCSKIFVIPLFLLKNFHYSIIPPKKAHIIPLIQEQNFRYSYSIIPLLPPKPAFITSSAYVVYTCVSIHWNNQPWIDGIWIILKQNYVHCLSVLIDICLLLWTDESSLSTYNFLQVSTKG